MHVGLSPPVSFVCLFSPQGKRLPAYLSADAEEGEVSDDDSADEIEDDFKLKSSNVRKESLSFPVLKIISNFFLNFSSNYSLSLSGQLSLFGSMCISLPSAI